MVAEAIASGGIDPKLAPLGILEQAQAYLARGGLAYLEAQMPDEWIEQLTIAGTPQDWRQALDSFFALGVHSVVLVPLPEAGLDVVEQFAQHLL